MPYCSSRSVRTSDVSLRSRLVSSSANEIKDPNHANQADTDLLWEDLDSAELAGNRCALPRACLTQAVHLTSSVVASVNLKSLVLIAAAESLRTIPCSHRQRKSRGLQSMIVSQHSSSSTGLALFWKACAHGSSGTKMQAWCEFATRVWFQAQSITSRCSSTYLSASTTSSWSCCSSASIAAATTRNADGSSPWRVVTGAQCAPMRSCAPQLESSRWPMRWIVSCRCSKRRQSTHSFSPATETPSTVTNLPTVNTGCSVHWKDSWLQLRVALLNE